MCVIFKLLKCLYFSDYVLVDFWIRFIFKIPLVALKNITINGSFC